MQASLLMPDLLIMILLVLSFLALFFLPACVFTRKSYNTKSGEIIEIPYKKVRDMELSEAENAACYYRECGYYDLAIKSYERILALSEDHEIIARSLLKLAALQRELGHYEEAQKYYDQFLTMYPGHAEREFAHFKCLESHYLSMKDATRDQSSTEKTLQKAKAFLDLFPDKSVYAEQVREIINICNKRIIAHELFIAQFYVNKYRYELTISPLRAARNRINYIAEELLTYLSPRDEQIEIVDELIGDYLMKNLEAEASEVELTKHADQMDHIIQELSKLLDSEWTRPYEIHQFRDMF
jgi:outer membrane assembly lipoprotein YfiO